MGAARQASKTSGRPLPPPPPLFTPARDRGPFGVFQTAADLLIWIAPVGAALLAINYFVPDESVASLLEKNRRGAGGSGDPPKAAVQ